MTKLCDFPVIDFSLAKVSFTIIKVLYKIVFQDDDHVNQYRRKLKTFSGFNYDVNSAEFDEKLSAIHDEGISNLIALCNLLNLNYLGTQEELALRISNFLNNFTKDDVDVQDDDNNDGNDDDNELKDLLTNLLKINSQTATKPDSFTLSFSDLESTIRHFDGRPEQSVKQWITQFEEIAALTGWTDLQQLIFAKRCLRGMAKTFIDSEKGVTSWSKLRKLLKDEFSSKTTSATVHRMLMERKKRNNETLMQYYIVMKEIASRANIEEEVTIEYIIDGVTGDAVHKTLLYGPKTFKDFKEKIKLYDQVTAKATGFRQQTGHGNQKQYPPRGNDAKYQKTYPPRDTGRFQTNEHSNKNESKKTCLRFLTTEKTLI